MNKTKKIVESPLNTYLIDAIVFEDFEKKNIPGVITPEKCYELAKHNHRICHGRGILNFDDGKVFKDADGNRQVVTKWRRTCSCVAKKLEKNPHLLFIG